jgi:hypothetical protein
MLVIYGKEKRSSVWVIVHCAIINYMMLVNFMLKILPSLVLHDLSRLNVVIMLYVLDPHSPRVIAESNS